MITDCTNCGNELGKVFVFVDRQTRLCLDCGEARTAAIDRHPAGKRRPSLTNRPKEHRTS